MQVPIKIKYHNIKSYITKDGSEIRELMHPDIHGNIGQSLAEAIVPVGGETFLHKHLLSEEIYHIIEGQGIMRLGDEQFTVAKGDTICIPPGITHRIRNTGKIPLRFLCCSCPAYSHDDTELIS
jgi:mannose-6-phosphate isomerase-like protein (cupin superfamily)